MFYSIAYVELISSSEESFLQPAEPCNKRKLLSCAVGESAQGTCPRHGLSEVARAVTPSLASCSTAGHASCWEAWLGENGSTECFGITQRILDHVVEGMTLF